MKEKLKERKLKRGNIRDKKICLKDEVRENVCKRETKRMCVRKREFESKKDSENV